MSEINYPQAKTVAGRIAIGVGGAALVVIGSLSNEGTGLICAALFVVILLLGWSRLLRLPHPNAARLVMALVALVALGVANWGTPTLMAFVLGLSAAATFMAEMLRRDGRQQLLKQAAGTFTGCLLMVTTALWIFVWRTELGRGEALVFGVVIAAVALVESIEARTSHALAFVNGIVAGLLVAWVLSVQLWAGLAIGVCTPLCYVLIGRATQEVSQPLAPISGATRNLIPHCMLGVVAYVLSLVLV
ncbi:MAG: hypothetical protein MR006_02615 [Arcanobacterium sp.]|nr:hypothetical protein [Arcanobacterium sp.]MDY5589146.1 hypothetical protein [Arcanobacterium sp.]